MKSVIIKMCTAVLRKTGYTVLPNEEYSELAGLKLKNEILRLSAEKSQIEAFLLLQKCRDLEEPKSEQLGNVTR